IFVEKVEPLKTGHQLLRLSFVQAIHPIAARKCEKILRVLVRTDRQLAGAIKDDDGTTRTAILAPPEDGWLEAYCPLLWRRRQPTTSMVGIGAPRITSNEYLDAVFGRTPAEVLLGSSVDSFGRHHTP